jgi:hypothetical protein
MGSEQVCPGQQSALTVQAPQLTHSVVPQMKGGAVPPSGQDGSGTHGRPPQQSALEAHDAPASPHATFAQRGTPSESCLHVSIVSQFPAQQSQDALHDAVASLQTSPFGLHPMGLRQTPTLLGGVMLQVTGFVGSPGIPTEPQQSVSLVQRSPTTWQPDAGWQIRTPVGS